MLPLFVAFEEYSTLRGGCLRDPEKLDLDFLAMAD